MGNFFVSYKRPASLVAHNFVKLLRPEDSKGIFSVIQFSSTCCLSIY